MASDIPDLKGRFGVQEVGDQSQATAKVVRALCNMAVEEGDEPGLKVSDSNAVLTIKKEAGGDDASDGVVCIVPINGQLYEVTTLIKAGSLTGPLT